MCMSSYLLQANCMFVLFSVSQNGGLATAGYFTCSDYPLEISLESFGKVFPHSQFAKRLATLHSGPLIRKLSAVWEGVFILRRRDGEETGKKGDEREK